MSVFARHCFRVKCALLGSESKDSLACWRVVVKGLVPRHENHELSECQAVLDPDVEGTRALQASVLMNSASE